MSSPTKSNELIAYSQSIALASSFFTAYDLWGRWCMAYFSFTHNIFKDKAIEVLNHGQIKCDFNYVDDIVEGIVVVLE